MARRRAVRRARTPAKVRIDASGRLVQTEAQFQQDVVDYATVMGWAMQHDTATNMPLVCPRCTRLNRFDGGTRRVRYACPTCNKPTPNIRNRPGWPDWWFVRPGRIVVAELKSRTGRVKPEQKDWIELLGTVPGIEAYIWRPADWPTILEVLKT